MTSKALLDALHAQLLADVGEVAGSIEALRTELPSILAAAKASAKGLEIASKRTLEEFEAMGHGLLAAVETQLSTKHEAQAATAEGVTLNLERVLAGLRQLKKLAWALTAANAIFLVLMMVKVWT